MTYKNSWILLLIILILGCQPKLRKNNGADLPSPDREIIGERKNKDEIVELPEIQDEKLFPASRDSSQRVGDETFPAERIPDDVIVEENKKINGFRIQILASKSIEKATLEQKEAEVVFSLLGYGVYIEFDSPMYKVRVGDCRNREQAEELQQIVKNNGYRAAWVVKAKVNTTPNLPAKKEADPY